MISLRSGRYSYVPYLWLTRIWDGDADDVSANLTVFNASCGNSDSREIKLDRSRSCDVRTWMP
jgi:hypothetical protein